MARQGQTEPVTALIDTNVLVRHLTGQPAGQAAAATRFLAKESELILEDLVFAEVAYVLSSVYGASAAAVAVSLRAILAFPSIRVRDADLLQRSVEILELRKVGFTDAYLIAAAERSGVGVIASFDRQIDRVGTVRREEPS
jgi:predicted nucleic acid-binding protein